MQHFVLYVLKELVSDRFITDIHIETLETCAVLHVRKHGKRKIQRQLSLSIFPRIRRFIMYQANMDMHAIHIAQHGSFILRFDGYNVRFRVSYLPSGEYGSLVCRVIHEELILSPKELLHFPNDMQKITNHIRSKQGLFLFCGSTNSGKSTFAHHVLLELLKDTSLQVITVEDPVERLYGAMTQLEVRREGGERYETVLRHILRHDPDVIYIGEIRNAETAKLAIEAGLSGHLVLSTLHAGALHQIIPRLKELSVSTKHIKQMFLGATYQTLFAHHAAYKILSESMFFYQNEGKVQKTHTLHERMKLLQGGAHEIKASK